MGEKKSFLLFNELSDPIQSLSDDEAGKLFKAIFQYQNGGVTQELSGASQMAFMFITKQMDRTDEHYEKICERNRINGAKGGRPKNPTEPKEPTGLTGNPTEPKITLPNPNPNPNPKSKKEEKDIKKKYGEYFHVFLTDKQYEGLKSKVDDVEKWIRIIDETIQEKGNIYHIKDFNLAIQKWYKKDTERNGKKPDRKPQTFKAKKF